MIHLLQYKKFKALEILLIITTKSVILTKKKSTTRPKSSGVFFGLLSSIHKHILDIFEPFEAETRRIFSISKNLESPHKYWVLAHFRVEKRSKYMEATGIVRRIEECVIIGQTA